MKNILIAGSLVLAATALPLPAIAQPATAIPTIVVAGKHQKAWNKGSKLEVEGIKELDKAKKDLVRYSADVVDAQNKRDNARARSENASADFRRLTSTQTYFTDADEAASWAQQVDKAASSWAKHDDRRTDGRDDLDKAIKQQRKAQAAVDKAQDKVDRGRTLKADAERLSALASQK